MMFQVLGTGHTAASCSSRNAFLTLLSKKDVFVDVHSVWKETEEISIFEFSDGVKKQTHQLTLSVLDTDRLNYSRWVFFIW